MAVVVGSFATDDRAQEALERLRIEGFRDEDLALLSRSAREGTETVPAPDDPRRGDSAVPVSTFATVAGVIIGGAMFGPVGAIIGGLATGGGLGAWLSTRGMTEDEAREYEHRVAEGQHLVAVRTTDRLATARGVLLEAGAEYVGRQD
jgi:hypothetical protein